MESDTTFADDQRRWVSDRSNGALRLIQIARDLLPSAPVPFGAALGAITMATLYNCWYLVYVPTGWAPGWYFLAVPLTAGVTFVLIGVVAWIFRRAPWQAIHAIGIVLGSMTAMVVVASYILGMALLWAAIFAVLLIPLQALFGASIAVVAHPSATSSKASAGYLAITIGLNLLLISWLAGAGGDGHLVSVFNDHDSDEFQLDVTDPSAPGNYEVMTLTYGSGTDRHRNAYSGSVDIQTQSVDLRPHLPNISFVRSMWRSQYWGFGHSESPLNGLVWAPESEGPFPLIVMVHGNHPRHSFSEAGYEYLAETLASRGFIVASIDQNFLNSSWRGGDFSDGAVRARAVLALEHVRQWRKWNEDPQSPFYRRVDTDRVAIIGHSRGGEAALVAAYFDRLRHDPDDEAIPFDFDFGIDTVGAIAPSSHFYDFPENYAGLEDLNYIVIHGGHDGDLLSFAGLVPYNQLNYSEDADDLWSKSAVYLYRGNHGYFNSDWSRRDTSLPYGLLLNTTPIMDREIQERTTTLFLSAWLESTLNRNEAYRPILRDYRYASTWLPDEWIVTRYLDSETILIADSKIEGYPGISASSEASGLIREDKEELSLRISFLSQESEAKVLEWQRQIEDDPPSYHLLLDTTDVAAHAVSESGVLSFDLAVVEATTNRLDFTVALADHDGVEIRLPMSTFAMVTPALSVDTTRLGPLESLLFLESEPVLRTYQLELNRFVGRNDQFDPTQISRIEFVFDRSSTGTIAINNIGIRP